MSTKKAQYELGKNEDIPSPTSIQNLLSSESESDIHPKSGLDLKTDPDKMDTKEAQVDLKVNSGGTSSFPQQRQIVAEDNKIESELSDSRTIAEVQAKDSNLSAIIRETELTAIKPNVEKDPSAYGDKSEDYPPFEDTSESEYIKNNNTEINEVELVTIHPTTAGGDPTPGDESTSVEVPVLDSPTPGGPAGAHTPGGDENLGANFEKVFETKEEFESRISKWLEEHGKKEGDFYEFYIHRICCTLTLITLLAIFITCFILFPRPLELCLKLSLDDQDIETKVSGDEGGYQLTLSNPNQIDVDIYGLEIKAYYGNINKDNRVITVGGRDYHIGGYSNTTSVENYTFTQNCTAAVPIATLRSCSSGYREHLTFRLVSSFKACVLSFLCKDGMVFESKYKSNCPKDESVCTNLDFFWWN